MIIYRTMTTDVIKMASFFPVVAILGPRQAGKTTLAREAFKNYHYVNLENTDIRSYATLDPRGFLFEYLNDYGLIIDEFQHVPALLSYIQTIVDEQKKPGQFILTGSQNFLMNQAITQSLAGRISIHTLLPLSIAELSGAHLLPQTIEEFMYKGSYPSLYTTEVPADRWYRGYIHTYLERDVRQLRQVENLDLFQTFIQLCAGRIGQIVNFTSLANDCGISDNTARQWLSLLEASYIVYLLKPHYKNFSKRIVKNPKLFFYDTGLVCSLLKVTPEILPMHPFKGNLFESLIISELTKMSYNQGKDPSLYFWRDHTGHEIDCIIDKGQQLIPLEIKAAKTISPSFFDGLKFWNELAQVDPQNGMIIYAGDEDQKWSIGRVVSWKSLAKILV